MFWTRASLEVRCQLFPVLLLTALAGCEQAGAILDTAVELSETPPPPSLTISQDDSSATAVTSPRVGMTAEQSGHLTVCSFNIQFLGNSRSRNDQALADVVAPYDIVVVQELVSPPYEGRFPDGSPFKPDAESAEFFDAMRQHGFQWVLSEEDTGTGDTIHRNGSSTEWWVAFYRPDRVQLAADLPTGFLASDRSNHNYFERVPYAFGFRTPDSTLDFVLISVHLMPGGGRRETARRHQELSAIAAWVDAHDQVERDFIILGDMNIEDAEELAMVTPPGFMSLNNECRPTNTNVSGPKPYDHVMFNVSSSLEVDRSFDMRVVNLIEEMQDDWTLPEPYPGSPYNHNEFRQYFSDHHPIVFRMTLPTQDDDGPERIASRPR